jgi:DnaJ-class molecular chaperone
MSEFKDYYHILGIDRQAGDMEIKQAYRRLAMKHHPDRAPADSRDGLASNTFQEINEAYHTLIDKNRRAQYNKLLAERSSGAQSHTVQDTQAEMAYRHGIEAYKNGQFKRAVEYFSAAAKMNPKKAIYFNRLGMAIIKANGPLEEARAACERAIQMEMYNPEHYLSLGIIYQTAGMNDKARAQYKEALKWDPKNLQAHARLQQLEKDRGFLGRMFGKK